MSTDPRLEAAKTQTLLWLKADGMDSAQAERHHEQCARDILFAADESDREQGIIRISKEELERIVNVARLGSFPNPYGLKS